MKQTAPTSPLQGLRLCLAPPRRTWLLAWLSSLLIVIGGSWALAAIVASLLRTPLPAPANVHRPPLPTATEIAEQLASHAGTGQSAVLASSPAPSVHLTGVMGASDPERARAILIVDGAARPVLAGLGDSVGNNWRIGAIDAREVRLTHPDSTTEITLKLPAGGPQDTPATAEVKERD